MTSPTYAIGRFAVTTIRRRPRVAAPMTSQLLFGEPVVIIKTDRAFSHVRCCDDAFEGYVRSDHLILVNQETFLRQRDEPAYNLDLYSTVLGEREGVPITFGARLTDFDGLRLRHGDKTFNYSGQAALSADLRTEAELLIRLARKWLYVPGLHAGRTPVGIDAPSLVQLLFRLVNVKLPRVAGAMVAAGRLVDFMVQAQLGDLAFFDNRRGAINHVGILLPDSTILHVYDRVRIDAVDHFGIFNNDLGRYTHRLRIVKRFLPDGERPTKLMTKLQRTQGQTPTQMAIF